MIINLPSEKLKIGMLVDLSEWWLLNPFWKNQFIISSDKQIKRIIDTGIKKVKVDTHKSTIKIETVNKTDTIPATKEGSNIQPDREKSLINTFKDMDQEPPSDGKKRLINTFEDIDQKDAADDNISTQAEDELEPAEAKPNHVNTSTNHEKDVKVHVNNTKVSEGKLTPADAKPNQVTTSTNHENDVKVEVNYTNVSEDENKDKVSPFINSLVDTEIAQALNDKSLSPDNRAKVVHKYAISLMENLLRSPTAEAIGESKKGISSLVDIILEEDGTAKNLLKIISHDHYTYTHSVNVGVKSVLLAKRLYKSADKKLMDELGAGFFLHDLGKVKINSSIINKQGKLTDNEMDIMRTHPEEGYKILNNAKCLTTEAWIIILQHHERDDGNGYPHKLSGEDIHPYARICAIADIYDALTAKRSYKKKKTPVEALKIMHQDMANHFNRELLENFVDLFKQLK